MTGPSAGRHFEGSRGARATSDRLARLYDCHRRLLLEDAEPFWTRHAVDHDAGGFAHLLERDGSRYGTTKSVWAQGRMTWIYARLFNEVEPRRQWRELAEHGAAFLEERCLTQTRSPTRFVTAEGGPVGTTPDPYATAFAALGLAEYARACGSDRARGTARTLFDGYVTRMRRDESPWRRGMQRRLGYRMMLLTLLPPIGRLGWQREADRLTRKCRASIMSEFRKPTLGATVEFVERGGKLPSGQVMICPGHAIEVISFLLEDALVSGDLADRAALIEMLDWALDAGWDAECGGLYHFTDVDGQPVHPVWGTAKVWWPHAEALFGTLCAYAVTGDLKWLAWHETILEYVKRFFLDAEYGEWFACLTREGVPMLGPPEPALDGQPGTPPKGDAGKSGFHVMRALLGCSVLAREALNGTMASPKGPLLR